MITAYKYLLLPNGIIAVFEKAFPHNGKKISIEYATLDSEQCLKFDEEHVLYLKSEIIEALKDTKRIYIAESEMFETEIRILSSIDLDDISIGKLLAYMEIGQS